jgi:hypothetical protein
MHAAYLPVAQWYVCIGDATHASGHGHRCDAGQRVAGEINCNLDPDFEHPDEVFIRNHAPKRTVLGIIGKDGCMSEYINLPVKNLHRVSNCMTLLLMSSPSTSAEGWLYMLFDTS